MLSLAIDTAGPCCSAALAGSEGVLGVESERIERGHAERLMPMIDTVLAGCGRTYADIDRIGVTTGPGSFTGVRIGVATARGLALALDIEAFGVGVMDVIAEAVRRETDRVRDAVLVVALPAARGDIFMQAVSVAPDGAFAGVSLAATKLSEAEARGWLDARAGRVWLAGSGATALGRDDLLLKGPAAIADHADIGLLAGMVIRGAGTSPPQPLYLRAPDARPQTGKAVAHA